MPLIFLAGVGGPRDPTNARGTMTTPGASRESARDRDDDVTCRRDAPTCRDIFRNAHFETFQFWLFHLSVFCLSIPFFVFCCRFLLESLCQPHGAAGTTRVGPKI
jgi:hypothetical protein